MACIFICTQNGFLRILFGSTRAEIKRDKEKLHYEGLRNLLCSPDFIRVINSKGVTPVYRVARAGQRRNSHIILKRKPRKRPLEGLYIGVGLVLKTFLKTGWGVWTGFMLLRMSYGRYVEHFVCLKCREIIY